MPVTCRSLLALLSLSLLAVSSAVASNNVPLWTATIPHPSGNTTSSALSSITSDALGDALVVINLTNTTNGGAFNIPMPAGAQIVLVNPKGHIIASVEDANLLNVTPVFVSAKRVIVEGSSGLVQYTPNAQGTLVAASLPLATDTETLLPATPMNQDFKYVDTATTTQSYVTSISRYLISRLHP